MLGDPTSANNEAFKTVCATVAYEALIAFKTYEAVCAVLTNEAVEAKLELIAFCTNEAV